MLACFSRSSVGDLLWNGRSTSQKAVKDEFTVLDNVQWFEVLEGKSGKSKAALELMGLGRLINEKARMLSMGQRERLQLARVKGGIVFIATHLPIQIDGAMILRLPERFPRRKTMVESLD
ncbi:hypothetical protein MKX01_017550 [Papaver californicum]|nr:hypothetical protein MKX01_017550 [Papaver californicum]